MLISCWRAIVKQIDRRFAGLEHKCGAKPQGFGTTSALEDHAEQLLSYTTALVQGEVACACRADSTVGLDHDIHTQRLLTEFALLESGFLRVEARDERIVVRLSGGVTGLKVSRCGCSGFEPLRGKPVGQ